MDSKVEPAGRRARRRQATLCAVAVPWGICASALCALVIRIRNSGRSTVRSCDAGPQTQGSALFHLIELMRDWNANHGAV